MTLDLQRIDAAEDLRDVARAHRKHAESLLQAAGSLQLLPENATKWVRLARLVEVARATRPSRRQRPISAPEVRRLLTRAPIADKSVLDHEDPFEAPFVVPVAFEGTEYLTVSGAVSEAATSCQFMLDALDDLPDEAEPACTLMRRDAIRLLWLSDLVARRAGLERWQLPVFDQGPEMHLPEIDEFERLQRAVVVRNYELGRRMGDIDQYKPWCWPRRRVGRRRDPGSLTDDRAFLFPLSLTSTRDRLIVASPNQLALAAVHRMAARAAEHGIGAQFATAIEQSILAEAVRVCRSMKWTHTSLPAGLQPVADISEEFFKFGAYKFAHVVVVADPLDGFDATAPLTKGNTGDRTSRIAERVEWVRRSVQTSFPGAHVLHVVLVVPIGRPFAPSMTPDTGQNWSLLTVSIDELRTLAECERGDPLGVWRFAMSLDEVSVPLYGLATSAVDLYARYVERDRRADRMSEVPRGPLVLAAGFGAPLAVEQRRRKDVHPVQLPISGESVLVQRETYEAPAVYVPQRADLGHRRVLELAVPCWIRACGADGNADHISSAIANAVAFNLWRLRGIVETDLHRIAGNIPSVSSVSVDIVGADGATLRLSNSGADDESPWYEVDVDHTEHRVVVRLLPSAALRLAQASEPHEAALISEIVTSIATLSGRTRDEVSSDLDNAGTLELPRLLHVGIGFVPGVHGPGDLPPCRLMYRSEQEAVDEFIGSIARSLGLEFGKVPECRRATVAEKILRALNDKLRAALSDLDAGSAFDLLVSEQERMENDRAKLRICQPGALTPISESVEGLEARRRFDAINESALASRYLIETAVRILGAGDQPITFSRYDELMAVSQRLIDFGIASDASRSRLADVEMDFRESGRLIVRSTDPFFLALAHQVSSAAQRLIERDALADWDLRKRNENEEDGVDERFFAAFESEFDVPLRGFFKVVQCLMAIAASQPDYVMTMPVKDLKRRLASVAGISSTHAARCLEMLSLNSSLLHPNPDLFDIKSTPWRFSRDVSFLRRPVLVGRDGSGGDVATWGARAPWVAFEALLENIFSGRHEAESEEMKGYIGAERERRSNAFDKEVADVFRGDAGCDVKVRATSIGNTALKRKKGQSIGDIDVLVTNHSAKTLVMIENKDFAGARTMREQRAELDKLMWGKKATIPKHTERVEFVRQRWQRLHGEMKLAGSPNDWVIRGLIVIRAGSVAAGVLPRPDATGGARIISFEQLRDLEFRARLFSAPEREHSTEED